MVILAHWNLTTGIGKPKKSVYFLKICWTSESNREPDGEAELFIEGNTAKAEQFCGLKVVPKWLYIYMAIQE